MTDENKIPMEDIIDQAKEGLDEQETITKTEKQLMIINKVIFFFILSQI